MVLIFRICFTIIVLTSAIYIVMEDLLNQTEKRQYSLDELLDYQKKLENSSKENSTEIIYNDSSAHALYVYIELLNKAIRDDIKQIKLFCGRFSMFRDYYERIVESLKRTYEEQSYSSEKLEAFDPYNDLISVLKSYLDHKDRKLDVIVVHDINDITKENCWNHLKEFFVKKQIIVSKLRYDLSLNHYMVVGDAYRRENSEDKRTALCCFNNPNTSRLLSKNFDLLLALSDKVSFEEN